MKLSPDGTKDQRYRRIMREVHYREGWLPKLSTSGAGSPSASDVMQLLGWFPIPNCGDYEKDYYPVIFDELSAVYGSAVYQQMAVGHGSNILKIDFHVGDPSERGVGIEVKMPTSTGDVQRAMGQIEQYQAHYGSELILFVLQEYLKPEVLHFFCEQLKQKAVRTVVR